MPNATWEKTRGRTDFSWRTLFTSLNQPDHHGMADGSGDIKATFDIVQADDREGLVELVGEYGFLAGRLRLLRTGKAAAKLKRFARESAGTGAWYPENTPFFRGISAWTSIIATT